MKLGLLIAAFVLTLGLFMAPVEARADSGSPAINKDLVNKTFDAMKSKTNSLTGKLKGTGQHLLRSLGFLVVSLFIVKVLLEGDDFMSQVATLINATLMYGILSEVLTQYGTGNWLDLASLLRGTAESITTTLVEGVSEQDYIWIGLYRAFQAAGQMGDALGKNYFEGANAWVALATFFQNIWMILFGIATVFVLVIAGLIMAATYAMSQFMIGIGLVFGPVMIPWLIWQPTQFLFDGWLKFMLSAVLTAIVGPVAATIGVAGINYLLADGAGLPAPGQWVDSFIAPLVMLLIAVFVLLLMMSIPSIAQGLMSGSGAIGFQMHKVAKGLAAASSALRSSASSLAQGAATGASAGARGGIAAARGAAAGAGAAKGLMDGMKKGFQASSGTGGVRPSTVEGARRAAAGGMAAIGKGVQGVSSAAAASFRNRTSGIRDSVASVRNAGRAGHAIAKRMTRTSIK